MTTSSHVAEKPVNDWRIHAAEWHDERAKGLRNIAATTRRDWTDPNHFSEEDRRANYADARENDAKAYFHEQCRDALKREHEREAS